MWNIFGRDVTEKEMIVVLVLFVILVVVFVVWLIHMSNGKEFYQNLVKPNFAPPPWLYTLLVAATIFILGYGGISIFNDAHPDDRVVCFTIWVASVIVLWASMLAFFEHNLLIESSYLLMLFLALHASLTYKLQFINPSAAAVYLGGGIVYVYLIIVMTEFIKLNSK